MTNDASAAPLRSGWRWRLTRLHSSTVSLSPGAVHIDTGRTHARVPVSALDAINERHSWSGTTLTLRAAGGERHTAGGFPRAEARRFAAAVMEACERAAAADAPELVRTADATRVLLDGSRPLRHSGQRSRGEQIARAIPHRRGALVRAALPAEARAALDLLEPLAGPNSFTRALDAANDRYADSRLEDAQAAAHAALGRSLTQEQALAVATPGDATLVLAGAGSGKTAVIIARLAHLVRSEGADPAGLLVLAFNRAAAAEIRGRLPAWLQEVEVRTFHAFALRVVAGAEGRVPDVSTLASDPRAYAEAVDSLLLEMLADRAWSRPVTEFIAYHGSAARSQFDFRTPGEYYAWGRAHELRTLSRDLVKSNPPPAAGRCSELLTGVGERRRMVRGEA